MSAILDKPFSAIQRIARTIFRGTPNLFTTSDLNRQIEALKYQLDRIESQDYAGFVENLSLAVLRSSSGTGNTITATVSPVSSGKMYVTVRGCKFDLGSASISVAKSAISNGQYACLILRVSSSTVTFADDPTHEIAGAKFADNTAMAAADQVVYSEGELMLVGADSINPDTDVAILAVIKAIPTSGAPSGVFVLKNFTSENLGFLIKRELLRIEDFNPTQTGTIQAGMRYDEALSILSRSFIPIGAAFPFFLPVSVSPLPYGWVPCGALRTYAGAYVQGAIEDAYEALYGAGNISFDVAQIVSGGTTIKYVRISQVLGITVPDTAGRFIRAGIAETDLGLTGGEEMKTLTVENLPAHKHAAGELSVFFPSGLMGWKSSTGASELQSQTAHNSGWTAEDTKEVDGDTANAGGGQAFDNRPPFVNSNYIMRVA
jgi:hypothetical protein